METSRPGLYAVIPAAVRYDKRLPANAKLLYGEISALTHAEGYCWATNAYLAELYDISPGQVGRLLAKLEELGYILREASTDPETGATIGRKIWIRTEQAGTEYPPAKMQTHPLQKCSTPPCKNAEENNINNNNIPPIVPQAGDGAQEGAKPAKKPRQLDGKQGELFRSFWARYPARKGRKNGKAQAQALWAKLSPGPKLYQEIMDGLEAYLVSDEVARGYAMDAARWLRGRRWEDEVVSDLNPDTPLDSPDGDYLWLGG